MKKRAKMRNVFEDAWSERVFFVCLCLGSWPALPPAPPPKPPQTDSLDPSTPDKHVLHVGDLAVLEIQ
jgi:hypothetical protein